ncbi:MAG: hypothetical protein WA906_11540 [Pacificimonas sp.]
MGYRPNRNIPPWARYVGDMLAMAAEVRFACVRCRGVYNVDLRAVVAVKGARFTLIDRQPVCKLSRCGGTGFFVAASDRDGYLWPLLNEPPPGLWTPGLRPRDFEPPTDPPPTSTTGQVRQWHEARGDRPLRLVR